MTSLASPGMLEALRKAIATKSARACGHQADRLRALGFTYKQIYVMANNVSGISESDWETLMYESDEEDTD